jgi:hypothetical protein
LIIDLFNHHRLHHVRDELRVLRGGANLVEQQIAHRALPQPNDAKHINIHDKINEYT